MTKEALDTPMTTSRNVELASLRPFEWATADNPRDAVVQLLVRVGNVDSRWRNWNTTVWSIAAGNLGCDHFIGRCGWKSFIGLVASSRLAVSNCSRLVIMMRGALVKGSLRYIRDTSIIPSSREIPVSKGQKKKKNTETHIFKDREMNISLKILRKLEWWIALPGQIRDDVEEG